MRNYYLGGDEMHPEICFDIQKDIFKITGISRPENPNLYYKDCFEWLREYLNMNSVSGICVEIFLEYFNTASSKKLLDLLELFEEYNEKGKNNKVIWCYEEGDDELFEAGEELLSLVDVPHEFKVIDE